MSKSRRWQWCVVAAAIACAGCPQNPGQQGAQPNPQGREATPDAASTANPTPAPHTELDRLALFDHLVAATLRRHAFSEHKSATLNLDFERDSAPLRADFRTAASDVELFRAIARLSAVRRDAHMEVLPIAGGLVVDASEYSSGIEFAPDFGQLDQRVFCVQRVASNLDASANPPDIRDVLVSINGQSVAEFEEVVSPYLLYSTINGRAWALATALGTQPGWWPTTQSPREFHYRMRNAARGEYDLTLPARRASDISWPPLASRTFPGFTLALPLQSFDVYRPVDNQQIVAFEWRGFEKDILEEDLKQLVAYASGNDLFGHDVIVDFTRSRGGADAVLALQILLPQPFKMTFGDLRISDVIDPFITSREQSTRLRDWLHGDVRAAQARGDAYTAPVPFKLRHLPADSDGVLQPAPQHFTGRMVALFGSQVGSQVDQVAAMLIDNSACYTIGMPTGGYSNTWSWEENVAFASTGRPVVQFSWSMGRTFRPNGEELEGNPPVPNEVIPLSSENVGAYYDQLLQRAIEYVTSQ